MTLPYSKVIKMAAFGSRNFTYLLKNFTSSFVNHASNFYKTRQALFHCSGILFGEAQEIKMPSLSPTMTEGKIVKWLKKEGDSINPGDILCDIETDKAIVSMEVEEEGILAKILIEENTPNVKIGSLIGLMVAQGEDWKNVTVPGGSSSSSSSGSSSSDGGSSSDSGEAKAVSGPPTRTIKMPSLSPTMTEGTIVKWLKKEGDTLKPGDVLCDIQTDKAVMSVEVEDEGILAKILTPDDTKDVKVGTIIALVVDEGEDWKSVVVTSKPATQQKEELQCPIPATGTAAASEVGGKKYGPAVKSLLSIYQLEPGLIKPTGRGNILLKEDVLKYISENNLEKKPAKPVSGPTQEPAKSTPTKHESVPKKKTKDAGLRTPKYKDIELSSMRLTIAKRLLQSKREIPHYYSAAQCDISSLIKEKDALSAEGVRVSLNDMLTKAVALALQMYPKANALCINNEVKLAQSVDICVAVATDKGLFTPIIKDANLKSLRAISQEIRELADKAKKGKLKPEEFTGGTFSISNLGMFGITHFKAIINPPQAGILAVGGTIESLDANLNVKKHVILNLTCDRRVLQEHEAAEFMEILKYLVENPKLVNVGVKESMSESI